MSKSNTQAAPDPRGSNDAIKKKLWRCTYVAVLHCWNIGCTIRRYVHTPVFGNSVPKVLEPVLTIAATETCNVKIDQDSGKTQKRAIPQSRGSAFHVTRYSILVPNIGNRPKSLMHQRGKENIRRSRRAVKNAYNRRC